MANALHQLAENKIVHKIYLIRGYKVMLDFDLSEFVFGRNQTIKKAGKKKHRTISRRFYV